MEKVHHNFGVWVGVELDWPKGSGDGVFRDKRYFKCRRKHAHFTKIRLARQHYRVKKRAKTEVSAKWKSSAASPHREPTKPTVSITDFRLQTTKEKSGSVLSQQLHEIAGEKMVKLERQFKELSEKIIVW